MRLSAQGTVKYQEKGAYMSENGLSRLERAALFALLAAAREVSNPELEEQVGFRLDGKARRNLNDRRLVKSSKPGRAYVHELADAGWRWCADAFASMPSTGADNMERATRAVLSRFGNYLHGANLSLADVFRLDAGESQEPVDVEARIIAGYRALASEPGDFVKLASLLGNLADVPRPEADAALGRMYQAQQINLIPQSNQGALSASDRDLGLKIGGESKHLISIEQL
jgi:hypothetical protein